MQTANNGMTFNLAPDLDHPDCAVTSDHVLAAFLLANGQQLVEWRVHHDARGKQRAWFVFRGWEECQRHRCELVNGVHDEVSASKFVRHIRTVRDLAFSAMNGGISNANNE